MGEPTKVAPFKMKVAPCVRFSKKQLCYVTIWLSFPFSVIIVIFLLSEGSPEGQGPAFNSSCSDYSCLHASPAWILSDCIISQSTLDFNLKPLQYSNTMTSVNCCILEYLKYVNFSLLASILVVIWRILFSLVLNSAGSPFCMNWQTFCAHVFQWYSWNVVSNTWHSELLFFGSRQLQICRFRFPPGAFLRALSNSCLLSE